MNRYVSSAVLATLVGGLVLAGDVVIPQDTTPFTVNEGDIVRIPAKGIAGTLVTAKVEGPAKATINKVSTRVRGKRPLGPGNHEVEVQTSGKGMVTVEVRIAPPNGPAETKKYEFEVK